VLQGEVTADRIVQLTLNGTTDLTTSDMASVRIPAAMNGWDLVEVDAHCGKDQTTGSPTGGRIEISVQNNLTNMLCPGKNLTINQNQFDSSTATIAAEIDTANDNVATGNIINVEIVSTGTGVTYLMVTLVFRKPLVV
jgi:hypothetical protein